MGGAGGGALAQEQTPLSHLPPPPSSCRPPSFRTTKSSNSCARSECRMETERRPLPLAASECGILSATTPDSPSASVSWFCSLVSKASARWRTPGKGSGARGTAGVLSESERHRGGSGGSGGRRSMRWWRPKCSQSSRPPRMVRHQRSCLNGVCVGGGGEGGGTRGGATIPTRLIPPPTPRALVMSNPSLPSPL